jgi:endonuclease YncB( thermonuclease family)
MTSRVKFLLVVLAVLIAFHGGTSSSQGSGERLRVIDGDTLQVDGRVVQLYGIDAPELGQLCATNGSSWHCGTDAALALSKLVALNRSTLRCAPWRADGKGAEDSSPGTALRVCEVGDQDLAVLMLQNGNGLALPGAFPDYVQAQTQAKQAGLGLWRGDFVPPWQWRAGVTSPDRPSDATRDCNVKGVIAADGQRLYYVPTDPEYRAISVEPKLGGKMFCSDDEARQAGWRRLGETATVARSARAASADSAPSPMVTDSAGAARS